MARGWRNPAYRSGKYHFARALFIFDIPLNSKTQIKPIKKGELTMRCSQIIKRFTLAALIAFSGAILTGCGKKEAPKAAEEKADPNIELVKNAVFPGDKSRSLGEALSANFDNLNWKAYKNDKNQQIVEFTGTWKHGTISNRISDRFSTTIQYFVNSGNKVTARFVVNKDQSVEFVSADVQSDKDDLGEEDIAGYRRQDQKLSRGIEVTGGTLFVDKVLLHK